MHVGRLLKDFYHLSVVTKKAIFSAGLLNNFLLSVFSQLTGNY